MSLTQERIREIEAAAQHVLMDTFGTEDVELPVDLDAILKRQRMTMRVGAFATPGVMGAYDRDKREIYLHKAASIERKVFTVAHEVGHHYLHTDKKKDVMWRQSFSNLGHEEKTTEQEANRFAAALLMPEHLVREAWDGMMKKDIPSMARAFGVSNTAMRFRLNNLGLLGV